MVNDRRRSRIFLFLALSCLVHGGLILFVSDHRKPITSGAVKSVVPVEFVTVKKPAQGVEKRQVGPPATMASSPNQPVASRPEVFQEKGKSTGPAPEAAVAAKAAPRRKVVREEVVREEVVREEAQSLKPPPETQPASSPKAPAVEPVARVGPVPMDDGAVTGKTPNFQREDLEELFAPSVAPLPNPQLVSQPVSHPAGASSSPMAPDSAPDPAVELRKQKLRDEYFATLHRLIARYRRYPLPARRAGQQGTVMVRFHIASDGALIDSLLVKSAGWPLLDRAALATVRSVGDFPPPPEALKEDIVICDIPIEFALSR